VPFREIVVLFTSPNLKDFSVYVFVVKIDVREPFAPGKTDGEDTSIEFVIAI
jgi:hypothetical protein